MISTIVRSTFLLASPGAQESCSFELSLSCAINGASDPNIGPKRESLLDISLGVSIYPLGSHILKRHPPGTHPNQTT